jgi:glycosyltransferase involved in cell wall biosynthesis
LLRIAYLDQTGELGGAEHVLLLLLKGMVKTAVDPVLICAEDGPFPERARELGITTRIISLPRFASLSVVVGRLKILNPTAVVWNAIALLISALRVEPTLRKEAVNIVQTNSAFAHIYGGLAARIVGVPCIWYFHDLIERERLTGLMALVWRILARLLAAKIVAVSRAVAQSLAVDSLCSVVYVGPQEASSVASLPGVRSRLALDHSAIVIGYVGRIGYVKGLDNLVKAAETVVETNEQVHFVVIGEPLFGEDAVKAILVKMVENHKLTHRWHWLGYDPEIASKFSEFDLLVLPSRREAFPLVLLEAGMASKAVIASRVGGVPEIVINDETGVLVSPDNTEELANAILRLINDRELALQMGRNAKERVATLFNLQRYHSEFEAVYSSLVPQN